MLIFYILLQVNIILASSLEIIIIITIIIVIIVVRIYTAKNFLSILK